MTDRDTKLAGMTILVVEDEVMVALMLEDMLTDFGCKAVVAGSVSQALAMIRASTPDGVLLDMNVHGGRTTAIAEELANRSIPFLLVTGYAPSEADPPVIKAAPRVQKPFSEENLGRRMIEVFSSPPRRLASNS